MIKAVSSGGLGDAVIILSQLRYLYGNDFTLTHTMLKKTLLKSVNEFYKSQNVTADVKLVDNKDWIYDNMCDFDFHAKIISRPDWTKIIPFPEYKINDIEGDFDILISPTAGRDNNRGFNLLDINKFCNKNSLNKIGLIGKTSNIYNSTNAINLINETSISETLGLIKKSKIVIAPAGFISIVAASMGKIVYTKKHHDDMLIRRTYYHPKWEKNKFISKLSEIIL